MKLQKVLVVLAAIAIASLSFMRLDCEDVKDVAGGDIDITKQNFLAKSVYFTDPFYAYKAKKQEQEGKYTIIDIVGKAKIRKFVPVLIYFSDYIDGDTFSKDTVTFTDKATSKTLPGLYLLTFRWDGSVKAPKVKDVQGAIEAAKEFAKTPLPKKSMMILIPFAKPTGKVAIKIDGKNLKDVGGNPIKGKPVKPVTAPSATNLGPATAPDNKDTLPADMQATIDETDPIYTDEVDADGGADSEPRPAVVEPIRFNEATPVFTFSGNAGIANMKSIFTTANGPVFAADDNAALLTSGELNYFVSATDQFCADATSTATSSKIDAAKMSLEGKTSSMTAILTVPEGMTKVVFDYYFLSAEIPVYCSAGSNYDDEMIVSIASTSGKGQPILQTVETQTKYSSVKTQLVPLLATATDLPKGFANASNSGKFALANMTPANAKTMQVASFDVSGLDKEISVSITVSDVGDSWNTTMALIDNIRFEK